MDIDQQVKALIENAPQDGSTPTAIEAIAPALKIIAAKLKHSQYYVLQNLDQQWVMTTLNHRSDASLSKNVIYAFPTLKDVAQGPFALNDPQLLALPVPVINILFQMMAMKPVDSVVFFESSGDAKNGIEVNRKDLQGLVQVYLQKGQTVGVPPNLA
jgi:hypothetical protein